MPTAPQLPEVLGKLHENQLALTDALESIGLWIDQRGSTSVSSQVLGAIATLDLNAEATRKGIAALKTS